MLILLEHEISFPIIKKNSMAKNCSVSAAVVMVGTKHLSLDIEDVEYIVASGGAVAGAAKETDHANCKHSHSFNGGMA